MFINIFLKVVFLYDIILISKSDIKKYYLEIIMKNIISIKNLKFKDMISYPDFEISRSEILFLTGRSGCGKSSLLKLFNMTEMQSEGNIYYEGKNIADMDTLELRKKVLLVPQDVYLFSGSIIDNFNQFYSYIERPLLEKSKLEKYLNISKMELDLDTNCDSMSGGERQRVFLAIALSLEPEVLMLDEPTSALDQSTSIELMENIVKFCKEKDITLIVVSHDKNLAEIFSERIINLEGGAYERCS